MIEEEYELRPDGEPEDHRGGVARGRRKDHPWDPYIPVLISARILMDQDLSLNARGLGAYLVCAITRGETVYTNTDALAAQCPANVPEDIEQALEELRQHGYLTDVDGNTIISDTAGFDWDAPVGPHKAPRPAPSEPNTVIYFVQREGLIKIGVTKNLPARLKSLSSGGSMPPGMTVGPVELLASTPGTLQDERALHARFARTRIAGTEWFRPSTELRQYIKGLEVAA